MKLGIPAKAAIYGFFIGVLFLIAQPDPLWLGFIAVPGFAVLWLSLKITGAAHGSPLQLLIFLTPVANAWAYWLLARIGIRASRKKS